MSEVSVSTGQINERAISEISENADLMTDPMNERFARIMSTLALVGLSVMIVFGILCILNLNSYITRDIAATHWGVPASQFWKEGKGIETGGYAWFLTRFEYTDCLAILGVAILASAPLLSVLATIPRCSRKIYAYLMIVICLELTFSVVRPLFMAGAG
jgi:hypothetical protein